MSQSIKNREAFFDYLEEGLQNYFDNHDRLFGGIIHLTVGVREGQVGGIIKSQEMLHYSGFTLDRVKDILHYVLPKYVMRSDVAIIADAIIEELRMGKDEASPNPKARKRDSSGEINLRGCKQHSSGKLKFPSSQIDAHSASASQPTLLSRRPEGGVTRTSRKKNAKQSTLNTHQLNTEQQ